MLGVGNGCRGKGRPRKPWLDEIREITGPNLQKLMTNLQKLIITKGTGSNGGNWSLSSPCRGRP